LKVEGVRFTWSSSSKDFGFWVDSSWFRVGDLGFSVHGFEFYISGLEFVVSGFGLRV
jgi:hypothetical protein